MLHQVALTPTDAQNDGGRSGAAAYWQREWHLSGLTSELQASYRK